MNPDTSITYREITRQQNGWNRALEALTKEKSRHKEWLDRYAGHVWVFVGCGTSYYIAQTASFLFTEIAGIRSSAVPASEVIMFPENVFQRGNDYLMIPISRSGTTTEIVLAARKARQQLNIPTLAVSCTRDSKMSVESNLALSFPFEEEKSVVMTSSFTTLLLSILHLAASHLEREDISKQLSTIPDASTHMMQNSEPLIKKISNDPLLEDFIFLGQGPFYGLANEAALKMQEMSISSSQSFHSLEYRHGPMSTATEHSLITLLVSHEGESYQIQLAKEMKKLGASLLVLHSSGDPSISQVADYDVGIKPDYGDLLNSFMYLPVLQLLGYYKALAKSINPDTPKNLSHVVTFDNEG
jgi:glucosamine--fructose-6-phosphate aminotransferase (isomerizing)